MNSGDIPNRKSSTCQDINHGSGVTTMEVLTQPEDITRDRKSTGVDLNPEFSEEVNEAGEAFEEIDVPSEIEPSAIGKYCATFKPNPAFDKEIKEGIEGSFQEEEVQSLKIHDDSPPPPVSNQGSLYSFDDLGNGIRVSYPRHCDYNGPYNSRPVPYPMRDHIMTIVALSSDERILSDIFGIYRQDSVHSEQATLTEIQFKDGYEEDILIYMSLQKKISCHLRYNCRFRVKGQWKKETVDLKDGSLCFLGGRIDVLFMTTEPYQDNITVPPEGYDYTSDRDIDIRLSFPEGCVDNPEELQIKVIPPETESLDYSIQTMADIDLPCFIGITKAVHVQHNQGIFQKQIQVALQMDMRGDCRSILSDYTLVDLHWKNNDLQMTKIESLSQIGNENQQTFPLTVYVDDFDRHAFVYAHKDKYTSETARLQGLVALGILVRCNILMFIKDRDQDNKSILVECVEWSKVVETIARRTKENKFIELEDCRSPDIFIPDGERIRIRVHGAVKLPTNVRKDHQFVCFLREGLHKHLIFPIEGIFGLGRGTDGFVDFTSDKFSKTLLHHAYFDAKKKYTKRPPGPSRSRTYHGLSLRPDSCTPLYVEERTFLNAALQTQEPVGTANEPALQRQLSTFSRRTSQEGYNWLPVHAFLAKKLLTSTSWKFPLRSIFSQYGITDVDSIINEAERNNPGNVKETIYRSLKTWTDMTQGDETEKVFTAIKAGLQAEGIGNLVSELENIFHCEKK